jgi:hypothetical protein
MTGMRDDDAEFENAMRAIDAEMRADDVPIPARQIDGARRYAIKYCPGMVILGPGQTALSRKVMDWFSARYGERLSIDPSAGHFVTEIDGDFFRVAPPKFWGMVKFFIDKDLSEYDRGGLDRPVTYNVLESVANLTKQMSSTLTEASVRNIYRDFIFGLRATSFLEENGKVELIDKARGDLATAVNQLLAHPIRSGESKWASLQAAEKLLKATIEAHGGKFEKVHKLLELAKDLGRLGIGCNAAVHLPKIQCSPGIRYGEEECTPREAFDAHKAFIMLTMDIFRTSRNFEKKLSWVDIPVNWNPPPKSRSR